MIERDVQIFKRGHIFWRNWEDKDDGPVASIIAKKRPVLLISNDVGLCQSDIATVIPITSSPRKGYSPTQVPIIIRGEKNWILCEQIYTCHISHLSNYVGVLSDAKMAQVEEAIMYALGLKSLPIRDSNTIRPDASALCSESTNNEEDAYEPGIESAPSMHINKSSKGTWTQEKKLELCVDLEQCGNGKADRSTLVHKYGYKNFNSLSAIGRRFRKELGV